jgi:hypothetical protein
VVVKRTMTGRWLFAAVALLTLVSQVAAASHIPALDDEPVSKCHDGSKHFCAEVVPDDAGPCALCQAGTGSVAFSLVTLSESCAFAESVRVIDEAGPRSALKFSPASPRAPPIG